MTVVIDQVPQLRRGQVWCLTCGVTYAIDSANALRHGWPKHCEQTMTIDSPDERAARGSRCLVRGPCYGRRR